MKFNPRSPLIRLATDRAAALTSLVALMRERGWRVDVCSPAALFVEPAGPCDAAVIDQGGHLAVSTFEIARKLRAGFSGPILVLTSLGLPSVSAHARTAACSCVTTPCRASHIVDCVYSALAMADARWARDRSGADARPADEMSDRGS